MSLFGTIGNIFGDVGKVAIGAATGGLSGALGAVGSIFGSSTPHPATPGGFTVGGGVNIGGSGGITGAVGYTSSDPFAYSGGGKALQPGANGACPKGYHLNKHALPACKTHQAVPKLSLCVRNRHMNPFNYRADGRALRRLKRADKRLRKIHHLFHRSAPRKAAFGRKR